MIFYRRSAASSCLQQSLNFTIYSPPEAGCPVAVVTTAALNPAVACTGPEGARAGPEGARAWSWLLSCVSVPIAGLL